MNISSDNENSLHNSRTRYDDNEDDNDHSESVSDRESYSGSQSDSSITAKSTDSSDDDLPLVSLTKQKKINPVIKDDEEVDSSDDDSLIGSNQNHSTVLSDEDFSDVKSNASNNFKSTSNISKNVDSNDKHSESSDDDIPIVKHRRDRRLIIDSDEEDNDLKSNTSVNKSFANTSAKLNASKNLGSFVDDNLFPDSSLNSRTSDMDNNKNLRSSSSRSFTKSFSHYRDKQDSESADENENVSDVKSSIRPSIAKADDIVAQSDDEFEVEFQRNIYSPTTRMSITGVGTALDFSDSDSEDEKSGSGVIDLDEMQPIEIPDSEDENEGSAKESGDQFLAVKPFNMTSLKNPLQASSPLPKLKLQPKISQLAKVYVSQEFFDKQVMKLNDMENELHKSVQLRGAFQIKLPDDGRRLSGRIDRLKLDIEQQQQYIATLEIQTSFNQNEIKSEPKASKKVMELSWAALDAATNEVKPKYTGAIGLKTFNAQKCMTVDTLKDIHESLSTCPKPDTFAEDPQGLKIDLMPHQKHALVWFEWRETQKPRGGILADDMGLGKTLTIIAHVLASIHRRENCSGEESDDAENPHEGWTAKGRKDLYAGGTLVVCPASLIGQWESEIKNRVKRNLLNYVVHHGAKRDVKARFLAKADIVITTYNIVSRECLGNNIGPLANIKWERVVLDEAHVIRNHKSRMSESVSALNRRCNWILTGTPIHNKEMDMFALLRFLKCRPFDDLGQFKKWIDNKNSGGQLRMNTILKAILLRRTKSELIEDGSLLNMPIKAVQVVEVILEKDEMNVYQKILLYSRSLFTQYLCQRRDRDDDRATFDYKKPSGNSAFDKAHKMLVQIHSATRDVKSHEILVLLLRLRQICCHPGLITAMLEEEDQNAVYDESGSGHDSLDIDLMEQLDRLNVNDNDADSAEFELPADERMSKASQRVLRISNPVFDLTRPSSKFAKLLEILKTNILPKNESAVIVSQWSHVLEIIGMMLRREGISYSSLTGNVPVKNRGEIVDGFNKMTQQSKIMLLSLTAGGVGLNLVGGNHLLLVDLHWNPQLEAQAQDRIYRVGQTKPVSIYKFICTNTIEQRIQQLQEKKIEIANGVLTGSGTKGTKLSIDDLKSLFEI